MKKTEILLVVLCVVGMFMAGCGGLITYLLVMKDMQGVSIAFSVFMIGIVLFLCSFFCGMRYYSEWN